MNKIQLGKDLWCTFDHGIVILTDNTGYAIKLDVTAYDHLVKYVASIREGVGASEPERQRA